ncbi:MAG: winged helix-turn-helix transcriptional regulator [Bacteroidia bacterium]|nr:winged helix-turn-helix transcriptional regulator [Bacteroidia bacterium]
MKDKTLYVLHANICKALANPIRIEIIDLLNGKEMTFGDILAETGVLKSNLSQHLSLMVSSGILVQRKEGANTFFKLSTERIATACQIMREVLIENIKKQSALIKNY